jgi:hypothetical protein
MRLNITSDIKLCPPPKTIWTNFLNFYDKFSQTTNFPSNTWKITAFLPQPTANKHRECKEALL